MNLQYVTTRHFEPIHQTYDWRDAALYALSLGMGEDPADEDELPYVYEGRAQRVVPSMCVTLGWPPLWISEPQTEIAWTRVLHGEQYFELHCPLPLGATVKATHRVSAVVDKGRESGALLYFDTHIQDARTNSPIASLQATNFLRNDGGCGNFGEAPRPLAELASRAPPDYWVDYRTPSNAALLYRLASRDYMPIHADPRLAREAGFERPISHGLNTLGLACRAVLKRQGTSDRRVRTMAVRSSRLRSQAILSASSCSRAKRASNFERGRRNAKRLCWTAVAACFPTKRTVESAPARDHLACSRCLTISAARPAAAFAKP